MTKHEHSLRTPLGRVRYLGAAGPLSTEHWWKLRLTSLALVPLSLYVVVTFFMYVVNGSYDGAVYWLRSPFSATFVILFLVAGFHHAANGLQVVIEDYVHCEGAKLAAIITIKFLAIIFAVLGILATVKVLFGV